MWGNSYQQAKNKTYQTFVAERFEVLDEDEIDKRQRQQEGCYCDDEVSARLMEQTHKINGKPSGKKEFEEVFERLSYAWHVFRMNIDVAWKQKNGEEISDNHAYSYQQIFTEC